jgi:hypothetical protein
MAIMTEEESRKLDELLTETTPTFTSGKQGIFARQKDMAVVLDAVTSRYLSSKMVATKRSPADLISDMVRNEMKVATR